MRTPPGNKRLLIVLGVSGLCVGGLLTPALQTGARAAAPPLSAAALQLATTDGLTYATAEADIGRQDSLTALAAQLQQANPSTYAGASFDYAIGDRMTVRFTSVPEALALPPQLADHVSVTTAAASEATLMALQGRINATALHQLAHWSTYLDTARNRVVLHVPQETKVPAASPLGILMARSAGEAVTDTSLTRLTLAAASVNHCDTWSCPPPMRGGVETDEAANATTGGYLCTTSFLAAPQSNSSLRYILSAGHCETTNVYHSPGPNDTFYAGAEIGTMANYGNGDKNDSEAINLNVLGGAYGSSNEADIYQRSYFSSSADLGYQTTPANENFAVTGVASAGQYVAGTYLCKSARTTGYTCGSIDQLNVSTQACESGSSTCYSYNSFFGAQICTNGGDSGGPIYSSNGPNTGGLAYGIVSSTNTYSSCDSSSETYSATMPNVTSGLGVNIITTPAPSGGPII